MRSRKKDDCLDDWLVVHVCDGMIRPYVATFVAGGKTADDALDSVRDHITPYDFRSAFEQRAIRIEDIPVIRKR